MKADISITKSRKGTEIVVSGKRINKYGIIAAIVFAVPMLILFQSIHGETTSYLSLVRFFMCILAAVLVNLFLHKLLFRLFSPIRMWQYRITCLLPFLLLGILPLIYGMTSGNYDVTRFGILLAVMSFDDLYILWQLRSFGGGSYITDKSEGLNFHVW
ncbi:MULTISPECIES: metalloprotease family protein [Bacteroides]|nr:metalloprotease family protein [Bacteroides uniformis]MCD8257882.1 metalloprotease family protein [Bacteroides uniformis]MCS2469266.1 metalloprotease family protein [Bacteroides uniformis]MDC1729495.1 metalloprotease family protein [Bacteroides uniformis]MDC1731722.1 metalloprotease family protein [Bacteroides uniformis]MDC1741293.1 metalloprotease family protein [Bacteroides uniformis]